MEAQGPIKKNAHWSRDQFEFSHPLVSPAPLVYHQRGSRIHATSRHHLPRPASGGL